jgi:hypothetical protein
MSTSLRLEGKAWGNFLDVELAPQSKGLYARWVQIFMQYCELSDPDKLLQLGTVQEIEDKIIMWLAALKDSGKATATMRTALACVVFFYSCNRLNIDSKFIARRIPKNLHSLIEVPQKK